MKLIDKITLPFYRIRNTFRDAYYNLKYRCQRFIRGYADEDIWNIDCWFIENMKKMLPEFIETHHSYPPELTEEEWTRTLCEMRDYVNTMTVEDVLMRYLHKEEYEVSAEDVRKAAVIAEANRRKFFWLFSQYFNHLWD